MIKVENQILNDNDFNIDEIESIELVGEEDTIDITVDDTHMFFANDIYTHNSSISSQVVTTDQMGGSIKKAQIAHVIISIGKTLEQKDHNLATLTLLKSRIGRDGVVFQNCKFNNEFLIIDTESQNTLLGHEEQKVQINANRAAEAFKRRQQVAGK
jgi:hypothetical protein